MLLEVFSDVRAHGISLGKAWFDFTISRFGQIIRSQKFTRHNCRNLSTSSCLSQQALPRRRPGSHLNLGLGLQLQLWTMVQAAIVSLKDRKGSSLAAIRKYIQANYKVDMARTGPFIRRFLKKAVADGTLNQASGTGANGRFRMGKSKKAAPKKRKAVKKARKPKKAKKAKKPKAKRAKKAKPKKAAKPKARKPKAKKTTRRRQGKQ